MFLKTTTNVFVENIKTNVFVELVTYLLILLSGFWDPKALLHRMFFCFLKNYIRV